MRLRKFTAAAALAAFLCANTGYAFPVDFAPGTPLVDALRALGYRSGRDVVINGELKGTVAMHMDDTTLEHALEVMSMANNFSYEFLNGAVVIGPQEAINSVETFKLKHLEPAAALEQFKPLVEDDEDIVANSDLHSITVAGSKAVLNRIRSELKTLDVAQQQVNIRATIIELNKSKAREMGLSYLSDTWSKDTSVGGYNGFSFTVTGSHEETLGKGKVLARPNVTVFDGREATIMMGDQVPVFTSESDSTDSDADVTMTVEYKDVGVQLEVTPRINDLAAGTITMSVAPTISTITEWVESGNNKAPQISERSVNTTIRVQSGQTILIGGLLKEEEIKSIKAIPFLSKLPVLGELFKSRSIDKSDTEIIIAITPTIVGDDESGRPLVENQTLSPRLAEKLHKLEDETTEPNVQKEERLRMEEERKALKEREAEMQAREEKLSADEAKYKADKEKLKKENEAMKDELERSTKLLRQIVARIEGGANG